MDSTWGFDRGTVVFALGLALVVAAVALPGGECAAVDCPADAAAGVTLDLSRGGVAYGDCGECFWEVWNVPAAEGVVLAAVGWWDRSR